MKNLKLFSLLFVLFFTTHESFSQLKFGGKTGLNLSNLASDNADGLKSKLGVDVGLFTEYDLNDKYALQLAIGANNKGAKTDMGDAKVNMALSYIEIQPSFIYMHKLQSLTLFASAGPYYAPYASGMLKANKKILGPNRDSKTESLSMGSKSTDKFKSTDYGASLSVGIDVKYLGRFGIQYELGLANISNDDNAEIKSRYVSFFISSPFTFGKKK